MAIRFHTEDVADNSGILMLYHSNIYVTKRATKFNYLACYHVALVMLKRTACLTLAMTLVTDD